MPNCLFLFNDSCIHPIDRMPTINIIIKNWLEISIFPNHSGLMLSRTSLALKGNWTLQNWASNQISWNMICCRQRRLVWLLGGLSVIKHASFVPCAENADITVHHFKYPQACQIMHMCRKIGSPHWRITSVKSQSPIHNSVVSPLPVSAHCASNTDI
jgi:hypothetical protein